MSSKSNSKYCEKIYNIRFSVSHLVSGIKVPVTPQRAITGDFIFVGDVGRPDLLEKSTGQIGSQELGANSFLLPFKNFPSKDEVAKGHIQGSLHIETGKSFSTWAGSFAEYQQQILLITDESPAED